MTTQEHLEAIGISSDAHEVPHDIDALVRAKSFLESLPRYQRNTYWYVWLLSRKCSINYSFNKLIKYVYII
jgi:hypothetical protein